MTVLKLVPSNSDILRKKAEKFNFLTPPTDPSQLARDLADTMVEYKGHGLSACQVGLPYRVFVMGSAGAKVFACYNPLIVAMSTEKVKMLEGCLSFPGVVLEIERPVAVKVRYTQPDGQTLTKEFGGMTARVVQHEFDHLEGKLFSDYVTNLTFDIARRKAQKFLRRNARIIAKR